MTAAERLRHKRLFLLDMDGTLYLGNQLLPGAAALLAAVRRRGGDYRYLTNNSSKGVETYIEKLRGMGLDAEAGEFYTSVDAAIAYFRGRPPYREIYTVGTRSLLGQLRAAGLPVTETLTDAADCLLLGYDTELDYHKLEDACRLLGRGVDYIATNPDWVCPTEWGYVPDCGSMAWMLEKAAGRQPRFLGKPRPDMVLSAMAQAGASPAETLVVGDRLYTDIAAGVNAGVDTLLVLSGESRESDIGEVKPSFVFKDVSALADILCG